MHPSWLLQLTKTWCLVGEQTMTAAVGVHSQVYELQEHAAGRLGVFRVATPAGVAPHEQLHTLQVLGAQLRLKRERAGEGLDRMDDAFFGQFVGSGRRWSRRGRLPGKGCNELRPHDHLDLGGVGREARVAPDG